MGYRTLDQYIKGDKGPCKRFLPNTDNTLSKDICAKCGFLGYLHDEVVVAEVRPEPRTIIRMKRVAQNYRDFVSEDRKHNLVLDVSQSLIDKGATIINIVYVENGYSLIYYTQVVDE